MFLFIFLEGKTNCMLNSAEYGISTALYCNGKHEAALTNQLTYNGTMGEGNTNSLTKFQIRSAPSKTV